MIDTHCHLEQKDYDKDREEVIAKCKKTMKAVIMSAAKPSDYDMAFKLHKKHSNFVFIQIVIHPSYIDKFTKEEVNSAIKKIEENKENIIAIGEVGLDYSYFENKGDREKQKELFIKFIRLAKKLDLPVVVHIRAGKDREEVDVFKDAISILEKENAEKVQLHMFGSRKHVSQIIENGWYVSMNAICLRSKSYSKVVRDIPIDRLMLETDAPWLHPSFEKNDRNDPSHVKEVAERIAEIKKISVEDVINHTTENAMKFYNLVLK